jgi:hypothetical protein
MSYAIYFIFCLSNIFIMFLM